MNVISVPSTIPMRRRRLVGAMLMIVAATAAATWAIVSAFDTGTNAAQTPVSPRAAASQTLSAQSGRALSPDDRSFSRATDAAGSGTSRTFSPDDRSFSRATDAAGAGTSRTFSPDDRSFSRGTSFDSSGGPAAQTLNVRPDVRGIQALTPAELVARAAPHPAAVSHQLRRTAPAPQNGSCAPGRLVKGKFLAC